MNTANASCTSMHERLRERTRDCHKAAERAMNLKRRLASIESYIELLQTLAAVHGAFEQSLSRFDWKQLGLDLEERKRMRWLAEDLTALAADIAPPPRLSAPPGNQFEALGALYVLEGSTLGGKVIFGLVSALPGISCRRGARFLYGHGPRTGELWRDFLDALNRSAAVQSSEADFIERGAVQAYAEFTGHLL